MNRTIIIKIKKNNTTYSNVNGYQTAGTTLFGLSAGSASIERILCDKQLEFGVCNSAKFEAQIFNITTDVTDCQIEVLASDVTDPIFVGKIDSSKKDETNEYRNIIAYDNMYTARDKDIAEAWNGTDIWEDENPITLKTLRNRLCVAAGLTVSTSQPTLPNDNESIPAKFTTFTSAKFGTIIKMVCELQGSFPIITADGKVKFIQLTTSATDITDNCDTNESEFEDYETYPIDAINVYSTSNDLTQTVGASNPTNAYPISGNIFLLSFDATFVTRVLQAMLSAISPIVYTPATLELIIGDLSLQIGDCVQIYRAGNQYIHYVFGTTLYDSLLVRQSINCPATGRKLDESSSASNDPLIFGEMFTKMEQTIEGISIIASSKNKTYRQSVTPVGATVGDLWYFTGITTSTRENGKWYRYNGSIWELTEDAGIGANRAELQIQSAQIEARVTKTGGTDATFSWSLTADGFVLKSNGSTVFHCNSSGIAISGYATIGNLEDVQAIAESAASDAHTAISDAEDALALADAADAKIQSWASTSDATYIDGAKIYTGSIYASKLDAASIKSDIINAAYINSLDITAEKITVTTSGGLMIFSADADTRTVYIGGFTVTTTSLHTGTKTSYNSTTAGVYLGIDGIGLGAGNFYVSSQGTLHATSADIEGNIVVNTGRIKDSVVIGSYRTLRIESHSTAYHSTDDVSLIYSTNDYLRFFSDRSGNGVDLSGSEHITLRSTNITIGKALGNGRVYPGNSATSYDASGYDLGTSSAYWKTFYFKDAQMLSARMYKKDIIDFTEPYDTFFDNLRPRMFHYNLHNSDRNHYGFILDEIADAFTTANLTAEDCGLYRLDNPNEPSGSGGLNYTEFIALNTWQIQKLKERVAELERRINNE